MEERGKNVITMLLVGIILLGMIVLLYPFVGKWINEKNQTEVIGQYEKKIQSMDQSQLNEMKRRVAAYMDAMSTKVKESDPENESEEDAKNEESEAIISGYVDVLDVGEVMGYVEIPKIEVSLPIYHGTDELTLQKGVGHMEGTSLPTGGVGMHCVLAGHSGLAAATLFSNLDRLELKDKFYIHVLDEIHCYQVDDIKIVEPTELEALQKCPDKDYVTLLTCTPKGTNTHRLLVRGERIEESVKTTEKQTEKANLRYVILAGAIVLLLVIFGIGIVYRSTRIRKRIDK